MFAHSITEPNSSPSIHQISETHTKGIASYENEKLCFVPQTSSSSSLTCFDKVPMALKKVVRLAVSAFYGVEQGIIIDYLIHYPCLREDHLADVLKLERKHLRAIIAPLRADHMVKAQMRVVISSNNSQGELSHATGGQQQFYYYYVDYGAAANAIRYRLDRMGEALERKETQASTRSTFRCSNASCGETYTDLDVDRLFDPMTGDLFCTACGSLVVLDGDNADKTHISEFVVSSGTTKREARKAICQFNDQLEPLFAMLRKVENVVLAPHLAKPEPLEIDLDNLLNVKRGVSGGNLNSKIDDMCSGTKLWKNDARSYNGRVEYEWYKTGISINIQSSADINFQTMQNSLMNRSVKNLTATGINLHSSFKALLKKELPSWLSSTSSNILRDYNIKILGLVHYDISMCANDYDQKFNSGRNTSTSYTNKRSKTSHSNAEINDKNYESQPANESTNLISPWGTTTRYRRGGTSGGVINYKEDDNLDETISRTLLIYESKGSNINSKPNQGDITNSTQIVNGISNTDVNKFDEQEIFDRETYSAYNNMGEDKLSDIKHHNYVPGHRAVYNIGFSGGPGFNNGNNGPEPQKRKRSRRRRSSAAPHHNAPHHGDRKNDDSDEIGLSPGDKMTQHFAKIHEPQKSEVLNVQQIQTPVGKVTKSRTSSTFSEKDPSGHIKTIKFIEKEKYQTENGEENNFDDKSQQFTQNVGQEIAKKLTHLGSSGKITVSSKIIKNGEVTTLTKVTNFGPKYIIPSKVQSPILAAGENIKPSSNSTPKTKLMHSPSTIKDLLLKWCRDKTIGYPNVEITNFSRSWANGLAFCALIHSYFPDAFDFNSLEIKNRQNNLDLAFKTAEEKADIFPLLEVEDMIEMKDSPDWKCVFTYVQSLYKGLKDKKHLNPFNQRITNENINYEGTKNKEIGILL